MALPEILLWAFAISSAAWLLSYKLPYSVGLAKYRVAGSGLLMSVSALLAPLFLLLWLLHTFVLELYRIPSSSMLPNYLPGDFVLVAKSSYGLRLPGMRRTIFGSVGPMHGDVVVVRHPEQSEVRYIKRVVATSGEELTYRNKRLYINGVELGYGIPEAYTGLGRSSMLYGAMSVQEANDYTILLMPVAVAEPQGLDLLVPDRHLFVMGDNRDYSQDSRDWGAVHESLLIGRVVLVIRPASF